MDRLEIQSHDVVQRYRQGRLTEEELEEFEIYLIENPEFAIELEAEDRLAEGVKELGEAVAERRRSWLGAPQYSMAASVLLAVSLVFSGFLWVENRELASRSMVPAGSAQIVPLFAVRSGAVQQLAAPSPDGLTVLLVDPGPIEHSNYRVLLTRDSQVLLAVDDLEPGYQELLAVTVPASMLSPGDYEVRIEGRRIDSDPSRDPEPVGRLPFQVLGGD